MATGGGLSCERLASSFLRVLMQSATERLSSKAVEEGMDVADFDRAKDGCGLVDGLVYKAFCCFFGIGLEDAM